MIEKQKQSIVILNRIKESNAISDEEYFTLMEFVVEDKSTQIQYIPYDHKRECPLPLGVGWKRKIIDK